MITSAPELMKAFKHHFDVESIFIDKHVTTMFGSYSFDVIAFDDYAHEHWGYTEEEHGSLEDFVTFKFGDEAAEFIRKLLRI